MSNIISFTVLLFIISSCSSERPSFLPDCCREDPKLGECLVKGTENLKGFAVKGSKKYGIPPISPLIIPSVTFEQQTDNLDVKVLLKNATVKGLESYEFTKFDYDANTYTFTGHIKIGSLDILSDLDFEGEVLQVKLKGTGGVSAVSEPVEADFTITGKLIQKDGKDHFQVVDGKADIAKLDGKMKFENFVADNQNLVGALNDVVNSNSGLLIKQVRPAIEEIAKETIKNMVNNLLGKSSYDEVLPHCK